MNGNGNEFGPDLTRLDPQWKPSLVLRHILEPSYKINKDYKLGYHKAAKLAQIGVWARMMAVTELPDDQLEAINIEPYKELQKAVDDAVAHVKAAGEEPKITFMPGGSMTVPVLEGVELSGGMVRVKTDLTVEDMLQVLDIVFEK